jgi:polysaccharide chain length determinant protein (PEP-CTERM system associated)
VLPGKKYTPEEIVRIALRRAWIVVLTLSVCAGTAVVVSKRLPNQYRSTTLIMLIPQRISDAYVKAAVTLKIEDRLNSLEDQILSRSRLERIILDLALYQPLRATLPMEDVVQRMRDDITIKTEGKESFRVSYVSRDARTAQQTTERLASLFIEENLRDRENVAEDTNQFLESQLEDAKRRLLEHEKKLEEYRSRFGGELPSQVTANLQAIQNAQVQLQNLVETADRARERRLLLERQIADLQNDPQLALAQQPAAQGAIAGETTAQLLQSARTRLQLLLQYAKPDHPDVRAQQRTVRDLEAKLDAESKRSPEAAAVENTATPAERVRQQRLRDLTLQIEDVDRQLSDKQESEKRLRSVVADYQMKLDAVPKRESDLIELTRDYATLESTYQNLLAKREDAKLAANLERRNIGEQFKVLDPARVPERPFSPNRLQIAGGGVAGGLALGLLIVGFLEYRDSSFKSEDDVERVLELRVLTLIPLMISDAQIRARRRRIVALVIAMIVIVGSGTALAVWKLRL